MRIILIKEACSPAGDGEKLRGVNGMDYLDIEGGAGADPQAVLGATLCMMSCTMQSGCKIYLPRIVENLEWLAALKAFDEDFRRLCRRLSEHWEGVVFAEADLPAVLTPSPHSVVH